MSQLPRLAVPRMARRPHLGGARLGIVAIFMAIALFGATALSASAAGPQVTSIGPTFGPVTGGTTVTINGTGFTGATGVTVGSTAVAFAAGTGSAADTTLTIVTPAHAAGTVDILVTVGGVTNTATASDQFTYQAAVAAPTVNGVNPPGGPTTGGTTVSITGTGFTGATAVSFGTTPATSFTVNSNTSITATSPAAVSAGSVGVTINTSAGISDNNPNSQFTYSNLPTVTGITPNIGPSAGGTPVTIIGTGFTGATSVSFGGTATTPTVVSDTQITVSTPSHTTGTFPVVITTPAGSSTSSAFNFTFTGAPVVTAISPTFGPVGGGTLVTVTGTGFTGSTSVNFGGTTVVPTVVSDTTLTVVSPVHAAGTVDILVTNALGTSAASTADQFTYGSGPVVTSISPTTGPITGGTVITLTGSGFTGATAVMFGTTSATPTVNSDTSITVTSPATTASGVVDITVVTPAGTSATSAADKFSYGSTTTTYTLYFRWSLIVWQGADGADIQTALTGNSAVPATNNVSGSVTAIFRYNGATQSFQAFFPNSSGTPGASDFTTFSKGQAYFVAQSGPGNINWTVVTG